MLVRRPLSPTKADVLFIRFGVLLLWIATNLPPLLWRALGVSRGQIAARLRLPEFDFTQVGAVLIALDLAWLVGRLLWMQRPDGTFGQGDPGETP